jgi:phosphoribosylanthranilate isomerase
VAVTRQQDVSEVVRIVESIKPSAVQLHAAWAATSIMDLREKLGAVGLDHIRILGVVASSEQKLERAANLREAIDFLLVDRTLYEASPDKFAVTARQFWRAKKMVHPVPVFLAGGLTPENVGEHIAEMHPDGVDVQTGVEYLGRRGVKDFERVAAFISAARA